MPIAWDPWVKTACAIPGTQFSGTLRLTGPPTGFPDGNTYTLTSYAGFSVGGVVMSVTLSITWGWMTLYNTRVYRHVKIEAEGNTWEDDAEELYDVEVLTETEAAFSLQISGCHIAERRGVEPTLAPSR